MEILLYLLSVLVGFVISTTLFRLFIAFEDYEYTGEGVPLRNFYSLYSVNYCIFAAWLFWPITLIISVVYIIINLIFKSKKQANNKFYSTVLDNSSLEPKEEYEVISEEVSALDNIENLVQEPEKLVEEAPKKKRGRPKKKVDS